MIYPYGYWRDVLRLAFEKQKEGVERDKSYKDARLEIDNKIVEATGQLVLIPKTDIYFKQYSDESWHNKKNFNFRPLRQMDLPLGCDN